MANVYYRSFTPSVNFANTNKPSYKECVDYFVKFLSNFSFFNVSDLDDLDDYWEYYSVSKNKSIVLPNQPCESIIFICKGAVRHYTETNEGQYIIDFATDCNFTACLRSFTGNVKTNNGFVASQNTFGLKITRKNYELLIKKRPAFEQLINLFSEKAMVNVLNRLASFQSTDAKGRYELLLNEHPDVFESFTMNDISNYLGINPETLSRLKKKK